MASSAPDMDVQARPDAQAIKAAPRALSMWAIGQGFEGTASDWTEYVVWLVGFISLIWFLWSRNVPYLEEDDIDRMLLEESGDEDDAEGDEDEPAQGSEEKKEK
eukprot:TRINITY_DN44223_c0_g1_i1.p3 TRINITY_DN44223_c0_g1~~TRINITY_DN44223_c0_g1_i1.p3  ORF type:complete len:104 (+),score=32.60 TRINITY_DN44223_c0_g1_i1:73-384(+)